LNRYLSNHLLLLNSVLSLTNEALSVARSRHVSNRSFLTGFLIYQTQTWTVKLTSCKKIVLKIQRYSAYVSTAFLGLHFTSTALLPLTTSLATSDRQLLLFRPVYQGLLTEPLLVIAPIGLHILSGLSLRLMNGRLKANSVSSYSSQRPIWKLPSVSTVASLGWILTPAMLAHTFINRALPLEKGVT
jgi:hypothetical protein